MASYFIIALLCIIIYLQFCNNLFPTGSNAEKKSQTPEPIKASLPVDDGMMGKSTFDVNAELRRKREREEEKLRKEAIAKGEMTEDGKEIAQEVTVEDCEVETKRVWKQVPVEELDDIFDESDTSDNPKADGSTIDDIDLAFHTVRKKNPTKEEVRMAAETLMQLEGTEFKDEICRVLPGIGDDIDRVMRMYSAEFDGSVKAPQQKMVSKKQEQKTFPERFEDFSVNDLV